MYLWIVIILNGVSDNQSHHLNCHKAFSPQRLEAFTFQPEWRSGYNTPV
jgi:hypothetical protein